MSIKNYRFVSPGVFLNEIDNSQLPASPAGQGPVIIGRAAKGPALRPTQVNSFSEFVQVFGNPSPGTSADDVWRQGASVQAPTYGAYAAQAYLRNSSPLTYIRLLGAETSEGTVSGEGNAGWSQTESYGLFVFESDSAATNAANAAKATVTIAGLPATGRTITITNTAGVTKAYIAAATQDLTVDPPAFANVTSNAAVATSLAACINNVANGHGTTITVVDDGAGVLSLTQAAAGMNGNATITSTSGDVTLAGFTGGLSTTTALTGALAAVFYGTGAAVKFTCSGSLLCFTSSANAAPSSGVSVNSPDALVKNLGGNNYEFKMTIEDAYADATSPDLTASFNFDVNSSNYIRKVFNTNPQLVNSAITDASNRTNYFLGETFDRHLKANISSDSATWGAVVKLYNGSISGSNFEASLQNAESPQIIGCDLGDGKRPNLFKFVARGEPGSWTNKNLKVSIQDIKVPTNDSSDYGTFSVVVRLLSDSDNVVRVVEQFNNCNLNPQSLNYVGRKIGDRQRIWVEAERRYRDSGDWPNNSDYLRVDVASDVDAGILNASYLPFGWQGIVKYKDEVDSNRILDNTSQGNWITGSTRTLALPSATTTVNSALCISGSNLTASIFYPAPELRVSASDGELSNLSDAYFGLQTSRTAGSTVFDTSTIDLLGVRGGIVGSMFSTTATTSRSVLFTLDDVSGSRGVWISGSGDSGAGALEGPGSSLTRQNGAVTGVLDAGFDRFTLPVAAGFDGLDILEMDPFANRIMNGVTNITDQTSYQFNSIRRSVDSTADAEVVQMNLASMPGITQTGLTTSLINLCEDRADALAVVDLPNGFSPRAEGTAVARNNTASEVKSAITNLRSRGLNSSYGCTFYPWVRSRDTINGAMVWLPPSVAALGTFSSSQRKTQVWFAPAGFNRGGLTEGSAGIPVVDVAHHLRRKDRDDLYAANINPIAKFPAEGIVIFGQKTLQVTRSALDRINVRRLMIFIKKRVSQMASTILFDPNVKTTWARFTSKVDPFLADVQTNFGLTDYKVVLDETTTTPDLIDRNILYAKIFLKPTRAIEYIAIDFNITRTGASFDD